MNAAYYVEVLKPGGAAFNPYDPSTRSMDDNVLVHAANVVTHFLINHLISRICHPPYSPDLAPANFFLFPKLKLVVKGRFFEDFPAIQTSCTENLRAIPLEKFQKSFQSMYDRENTCIVRGGDYIEN